MSGFTWQAGVPAARLRPAFRACVACGALLTTARPCPQCGTVQPGDEWLQDYLVVHLDLPGGRWVECLALPAEVAGLDWPCRVLGRLGAWPWAEAE